MPSNGKSKVSPEPASPRSENFTHLKSETPSPNMSGEDIKLTAISPSNEEGEEAPAADAAAADQGGADQLPPELQAFAMRDLEISPAETLHKLAREGRSEELRNLLEHHSSRYRRLVNTLDNEKLSALHYAARYNSLESVQVLVEIGHAIVDIENDERATPLHLAARYRRKRNAAKSKMGQSVPQHAPPLRDAHMAGLFPTSHPKDVHEGDSTMTNVVEAVSKEAHVFIHKMQHPLHNPFQMPSVKNSWGMVVRNAKRLIEEENLPTKENSVILYLVSKGADVNNQDFYGCTALHYAAMRGNEIATQHLLMIPGINPEITDNEKMTPLHLSCYHNHVEIAKMLLDRRCNLLCVEETGCLPLHLSTMEGGIEITQMLLDAAERNLGVEGMKRMLNQPDRDFQTPLHSAVNNGHLALSKLLIEKGAHVNLATNQGETALHFAAHFGSVSLVRLLVENGATVGKVDMYMQSALHRASSRNHVEVIEYLISQNANTERRDNDSYTAILLAATYGHCNALDILIKKGGNLLAQEKSSKTALFLAVEENHLACVDLILNAKDGVLLVDIPDKYNNTPLHVACSKGHSEIVNLLMKKNAPLDAKNEEEQTPLHLAAKHGRTQIVRTMTHGPGRSLVFDEDEDSNTALHLASFSGHAKVCQVLLDAGAEIEARNCNKWTPLDCAASKGNFKAAELLLNNDSPVDPQDKSKVTPLYLACKNGHVELVQLLINNGADMSIKVAVEDDDPSTGYNCLDIAIDNGHNACVKAIIKSSRWEDAMRNQIKAPNGRYDTPMRKLIRKMPEIAEEVFNRCTQKSEHHPDHPDFNITFNYEFLDDTYAHWTLDHESMLAETKRSNKIFGFFNELNKAEDIRKMSVGTDDVKFKDPGSVLTDKDDYMDGIYDVDDKVKKDVAPYVAKSEILKNNHPLMIMAESQREVLLSHPLVISLLQHKWSTFGRIVYYINLFIYGLFLTFLSVYMVSSTAPYMYFINVTTSMNNSLTLCDQLSTNPKVKVERSIAAHISGYGVLVLSVIALVKETIQMVVGRENYFSFDNIIEWGIYILSIITVVNVGECQRTFGIRENWQWQTGAMAIFFSWLNLILFLRKVPRFGIFVVMFTDVLKTFFNFFLVFFLFILAFSFGFYVLLQNQVTFRTMGFSILKISVMMIGELDYESMFNEAADEENMGDSTKQVYYDFVSYLLFVIFLILLPIIIMNLLVGLAVDDIKAVQEKAVLKRLGMQVDLALGVEALLPHTLRRRFVRRTIIVYPNTIASCFRRCMGLKGTSQVDGALLSALNAELDDTEKMQENQERIQSQLMVMKQRVKGLKTLNDRLTRMVEAIMKKLDVSFMEVDEAEETAQEAMIEELAEAE